ncbi:MULTISPECIES: hypothetical protein [Turicibacter]|jgi:hypothetical protein|uniref:Uncharacterized protein n=2 Tax=Turicibacter sanguinis TaxID=154288 RepID=A0A173RV64_9FIRM|nr:MULTISPECIES: hypothetical protein [Turicibacter]EFF64881.1 hypothetical protein CUW_0703 [Turicibacter sanguinis PC909]EGC92396.1 hypothetical protein HMPREF9402_2195 [Turicibacter sp. HGF1]MBP3903364.1 hypothetical protein [Turicibacter sp.]MCU7190376.1 hypothetical protein [Turicibacter sanguinis]MCU7198068.1 hypothetical protein [Turicibacter sanguinis]
MDQMYLVMFLREGGYIESNVDLLELDRSTLEQVIERLVDYHNSEELEDELRGCGLNARAIIRTYLNHVGDYGYEDFYHLELVSPKSL